MTLRDLLSHTAGTTVSGFPGYPAGAPLPTLRQILDGAPPANTPPVRVDIPVGERFRYSGGGTTIVQQLLIEVTGSPFPQLMEELVLRPVGMAHSTFRQPLLPALHDRATSAHDEEGRPLPGRWHTYPELAAAGLWTAPSDLARFVLAVQEAVAGRRGAVLGQPLAREMLVRQNGGPAGLGPFVDGEAELLRLFHSGGNQGFSCRFVAYAHRGQGAVAMTNASDRGGAALIDELLNSVAAVYGWPDYLARERVPIELPAHLRARYAGDYDLPRFGRLRISLDGGRLLAHVPGDATLELIAESHTSFFFAENPAEIAFVLGHDGGVIGAALLAGGQSYPAQRLTCEADSLTGGADQATRVP